MMGLVKGAIGLGKVTGFIRSKDADDGLKEKAEKQAKRRISDVLRETDKSDKLAKYSESTFGNSKNSDALRKAVKEFSEKNGTRAGNTDEKNERVSDHEKNSSAHNYDAGGRSGGRNGDEDSASYDEMHGSKPDTSSRERLLGAGDREKLLGYLRDYVRYDARDLARDTTSYGLQNELQNGSQGAAESAKDVDNAIEKGIGGGNKPYIVSGNDTTANNDSSNVVPPMEWGGRGDRGGADRGGADHAAEAPRVSDAVRSKHREIVDKFRAQQGNGKKETAGSF